MADYDGDLTDVNPDLLKLCANAGDWREQRRRAMKAKIFGAGGGGKEGEASGNAPQSGTAGPSPASTTAIPASQQASESYILQQLLSHKRRREDATQQQQQQRQGAQYGAQNGGELSMKEKLMQKYGRN